MRDDATSTTSSADVALQAIIDREVRTIEIRDGLLFGSDPACDIILPDAEPRHVRVRVFDDFCRLYPADSQIRLCDASGSRVVWLPLKRGQKFFVGKTIFEVIQEPPAILFDRPPKPVLDRHACPRCRANLIEIDLAAKFCPHCGAPLPADCPAWPVVADDPAPEPQPTVRWWMKWIPSRLRTRMARDPLFFSRPTTVLAYINTLLNLGLRYEAGVSGDRQPDEAMRYYKKAASLGNIPARARLKIKLSNTK
jgi:hypothetical protein